MFRCQRLGATQAGPSSTKNTRRAACIARSARQRSSMSRSATEFDANDRCFDLPRLTVAIHMLTLNLPRWIDSHVAVPFSTLHSICGETSSTKAALAMVGPCNKRVKCEAFGRLGRSTSSCDAEVLRHAMSISQSRAHSSLSQRKAHARHALRQSIPRSSL
jgi:hypothetical protein